MRAISLILLAASLCLFPSCQRSTYKREQIKEDIRQLAKKEFQADVTVEESGNVLGVEFKLPHLRSELTSGDDWLSKKVQGLLMILIRVTLSVDLPPDFFVLRVVDRDDPNFGFLFTRNMEDMRKAWADVLSHGQMMDRSLDEYVVGKRTIPMDPEESDSLLLLLMSMDSTESAPQQDLKSIMAGVRFPEFLAKVAANSLRRHAREDGDMKKNLFLRQVQGSFKNMPVPGVFELSLELSALPGSPLSPEDLRKTVYPQLVEWVREIFRSYKFTGFSSIRLVEKKTGDVFQVNSGGIQ